MTEAEKLKQQQTNGLTQKEMLGVQRSQIEENVETVEANNGTNITDKPFKESYEGYKIPKVEDKLVHLAMETRAFNMSTGERLSSPFVQIFDEKLFERMKKEDAFKGYTTYILHHPKIDEIKAKQEEISTQGNRAIDDQANANSLGQ